MCITDATSIAQKIENHRIFNANCSLYSRIKKSLLLTRFSQVFTYLNAFRNQQTISFNFYMPPTNEQLTFSLLNVNRSPAHQVEFLTQDKHDFKVFTEQPNIPNNKLFGLPVENQCFLQKYVSLVYKRQLNPTLLLTESYSIIISFFDVTIVSCYFFPNEEIESKVL